MSQKRVLLINDEISMKIAQQMMFEHHGWNVDYSFGSIRNFVAAGILDKKIDLILGFVDNISGINIFFHPNPLELNSEERMFAMVEFGFRVRAGFYKDQLPNTSTDVPFIFLHVGFPDENFDCAQGIKNQKSIVIPYDSETLMKMAEELTD